jgi:hypothetical protein
MAAHERVGLRFDFAKLLGLLRTAPDKATRVPIRREVGRMRRKRRPFKRLRDLLDRAGR